MTELERVQQGRNEWGESRLQYVLLYTALESGWRIMKAFIGPKELQLFRSNPVSRKWFLLYIYLPRFDSWIRKICWRRDRLPTPVSLGFPCGSAGKESACKGRDLGLIPGWRRSSGSPVLPTPVFWPGEFHGLYSPWGHMELDTTEQLFLSFYLLSQSFSQCEEIVTSDIQGAPV